MSSTPRKEKIRQKRLQRKEKQKAILDGVSLNFVIITARQ